MFTGFRARGHTLRRYVLAHRDRMTLVAILLVAALVRWGDLGHTADFQYDQGELSQLVLDMLHGERFPLLGVESSAGVRNSPMTVYLLAPLFVISSHPLWVTFGIAMFNVIGVGLLWWIVRRTIGPRAADWSALIYALNPHAIRYSRAIWAQNYHTPFILAGLGLAMLGFWDRRRWAQVLSLPLLIVGVQVHYAAWPLVATYGVIVLLGWRQIDWRALVVSGVLAALTLAPFVYGSLDSGDGQAFSDKLNYTRAIIQYDLRLRQETIDHVIDLATGEEASRGTDTDKARTVAIVPEWTWPWRAIGALGLIGYAALWWRRAWRRMALVATAWIAPLMILFVPNWTGSGIYPHYLIPLIPLLALLSGTGAVVVLDALRSIRLGSLRPAAPVAACVLALTLVSWVGWYYAQLSASQTFTPEPHSIPLAIHYLLDVRADLSDERDVLLIGADSHTSGVEVWRSLLYNSADCVRAVIVLQGGLTVIPAGDFVAVAPPGANPDDDLYRQYIGDDPQRYATRPGERPYSVQHYPDGITWEGGELHPLGPVKFANGVQLTGYRVEAGRVTLSWLLPGRSLDIGYLRQFIHLLDAEGNQLAAMDLDYWPGQSWCVGDQIITWADLPLAEVAADKVVTLRAGLYTVPDEGGYRYVDVLDAVGHPAAPWVEVPLDQGDDLK